MGAPGVVTMPKLGLTMTTGTIVRWLKAGGERVELGEPLLEVSTEKINYEVESPLAGTLVELLGREGDEFVPGAPIGRIAAEGDPNSAADVQGAEVARPAREEARIVASPAARKVARESGIDLSAVRGSGPRGRVTLDDLQNTPPAAKVAPAAYPPRLPPERRTIFRRMTEVASLPLASVETEARVDAFLPIVEAREAGWTAIVAFATARALRDHPALRTDARTGAPFARIDLGIAADTPRGLVVPVLREAADRSLRDLQRELERLSGAAREGRLAPADAGAAAFTISNLGPQRVEGVVPLVDPPQTAILGVGTVTRKPVVAATTTGETIVPGSVMRLVVTFDHRFIDGAPAARFLSDLATLLATPARLLL